MIPSRKGCQRLYDLENARLRVEILLSSHQVLFLILKGDERPPREKLGHDDW